MHLQSSLHQPAPECDVTWWVRQLLHLQQQPEVTYKDWETASLLETGNDRNWDFKSLYEHLRVFTWLEDGRR